MTIETAGKSGTARSTSANAINASDFAPLFAALLAVTLAAAFLLNFSFKEESAFSLVNHTRDVYHDSQKILLSSQKVDMSVRNYLLTKNSKYLVQYADAKQSLRSQLARLTNLVVTPIGQSMVKDQLGPAIGSFVVASDALLDNKSPDLQILQKQEDAKDFLMNAMQTIEQRQVVLLQQRSEKLAALSKTVAQTRLITVLVAMAATVFSLITLQLVMRKDRIKIRSLENEIENTLIAEKIAREALEVADKSNQLKTEFIANISHELRTPMVGILGPAELLYAMPLTNGTKPLISMLLDNSKQLLGVLNDLLNFSKFQRNEMASHSESFSVRELVAQAVLSSAPRVFEKHLQITQTVDEIVPAIIVADKEKVRQVLLSLISNSIKFTRDGSIDVSVDLMRSGQLRIAVSDTGIGINEEGIAKLFQPFVQVDGSITRHVGGAGLGLFLAKRFVELMGGDIGVKSEPGSGSIFWFTFETIDATEILSAEIWDTEKLTNIANATQASVLTKTTLD